MANEKITNKKKRYEATGLVLGCAWGGGEGSYPTRIIKADTLDNLLEKAIDKLRDNSLDSGMGFESLKGARLNVKLIETITVGGKDYDNESTNEVFIGELSPEEMDFLENSAMNL